jgi:hypothetical protein
MLTEQAIATVVFLILLAISVVGYFISSRNGDKLDRDRQQRLSSRDDTSRVIVR